MATVTIFRTDQVSRAETRALSTSRGMVGAVLLVLVAAFLLAASAFSSAAPGDGAGSPRVGAFILDPSVASAAG